MKREAAERAGPEGGQHDRTPAPAEVDRSLEGGLGDVRQTRTRGEVGVRARRTRSGGQHTHRRADRVNGRLEIDQDAGADALGVSDQAEQQVVGADLARVVRLGLLEGELQAAPRARSRGSPRS
jgi:hypothetical protein